MAGSRGHPSQSCWNAPTTTAHVANPRMRFAFVYFLGCYLFLCQYLNHAKHPPFPLTHQHVPSQPRPYTSAELYQKARCAAAPCRRTGNNFAAPITVRSSRRETTMVAAALPAIGSVIRPEVVTASVRAVAELLGCCVLGVLAAKQGILSPVNVGALSRVCWCCVPGILFTCDTYVSFLLIVCVSIVSVLASTGVDFAFVWNTASIYDKRRLQPRVKHCYWAGYPQSPHNIIDTCNNLYPVALSLVLHPTRSMCCVP